MQGRPGAGHIDIANAVLEEQGIHPVDKQDCYRQMFKLGYARVVETTASLQVEHCRKLTSAQRRFLKSKEQGGKSVTLNQPQFVSTKDTVE